jgi:hypothetical protein
MLFYICIALNALYLHTPPPPHAIQYCVKWTRNAAKRACFSCAHTSSPLPGQSQTHSLSIHINNHIYILYIDVFYIIVIPIYRIQYAYRASNQFIIDVKLNKNIYSYYTNYLYIRYAYESVVFNHYQKRPFIHDIITIYNVVHYRPRNTAQKNNPIPALSINLPNVTHAKSGVNRKPNKPLFEQITNHSATANHITKGATTIIKSFPNPPLATVIYINGRITIATTGNLDGGILLPSGQGLHITKLPIADSLSSSLTIPYMIVFNSDYTHQQTIFNLYFYEKHNQNKGPTPSWCSTV